jgi:hypothetical protein
LDEIRKITTELAKIDEGKVKAIAEGDRVYLMIQDAPAELRRLADALEKIDVREIKALVAYAKPGAAAKKLSARSEKMLEGAARNAVETRIDEVLARLGAKFKKLGASSVSVLSIKNGLVKLAVEGDAVEVEKLKNEALAAFERDVPEIKKVEVEAS